MTLKDSLLHQFDATFPIFQTARSQQLWCCLVCARTFFSPSISFSFRRFSQRNSWSLSSSFNVPSNRGCAAVWCCRCDEWMHKWSLTRGKMRTKTLQKKGWKVLLCFPANRTQRGVGARLICSIWPKFSFILKASQLSSRLKSELLAAVCKVTVKN